jgi:adenylate cyclase
MAEDGSQAGWSVRLRQALKQIGPIRLVGTFLFLLVALALARFSWQLPLASDAERALYDMRFFQAAEQVGQDDRIVLVYYDDKTLEQLGKRSPLDRKMLADALKTLDAIGPKAIGIDILFDQPQAEDPLLIGTLRGMRTPTYLGFATQKENEQQMAYWQEEFLRNFLRQVASGPVRPASIRLEEDPEDSVMRRWPNQLPNLPPLLANAMSPVHPEFRTYTGSIDYRLPKDQEAGLFAKFAVEFIAIDFEGQIPDMVRDKIAGKYVLIGGNIEDLDDFETPMTRATNLWTKGLEVHAQLLAQLLDGRMRPPVPNWALWLAALGLVAAGGLTSLLELRGWKLAGVLAVQLLFIAGLPFALQDGGLDTIGLPAFGWGAGWALAFAAVGASARAVGSEQRRFAQSTLGKYLPADVAAEILKDPDKLALKGEKRQIYALFTDLEGFTKLSHAITPEQLSNLLNRYLDVLSETVLNHGGTIDKFVGDAVVAFWGAPIARADDADRALKAAVAMFEAGEQFRDSGGVDIPPLGCTRVGLHRGEAVVGNFGGKGRIQYTALGDGMNTASRLESANKLLKTTILVSREAKEQCSLDIFRPMGRIVLSGRATPVEVWEPMPGMAAEDRRRLTEAWLRFDGGDPAALAELEAVAAERQDAALDNFVYRIRQAGPGGHFVLGSK